MPACTSKRFFIVLRPIVEEFGRMRAPRPSALCREPQIMLAETHNPRQVSRPGAPQPDLRHAAQTSGTAGEAFARAKALRHAQRSNPGAPRQAHKREKNRADAMISIFTNLINVVVPIALCVAVGFAIGRVVLIQDHLSEGNARKQRQSASTSRSNGCDVRQRAARSRAMSSPHKDHATA